jgi:hypothetical protein
MKRNRKVRFGVQGHGENQIMRIGQRKIEGERESNEEI